MKLKKCVRLPFWGNPKGGKGTNYVGPIINVKICHDANKYWTASNAAVRMRNTDREFTQLHLTANCSQYLHMQHATVTATTTTTSVTTTRVKSKFGCRYYQCPLPPQRSGEKLKTYCYHDIPDLFPSLNGQRDERATMFCGDVYPKKNRTNVIYVQM